MNESTSFGVGVVSHQPPPGPPPSTMIAAMNLPNGQEVEVSSYGSSASGQSTTRIMSAKNIDPNEVAIAVMGATGSGKTTFINLVSSSTLRIGRGLRSCTSVVQVAKPFELDGRNITLVDTPGFDDTTKSDTDILRMIAAFLATTYQEGMKLAGVIYFHRISDFRMGGISTRNFKMFRQLCGESTLKNVIIATNMWGEVSKEVGEAREAELMSQDIFFKPVLEKRAQMARHDNTLQSAQAILQQIIGNRPLSLQIQRELVDQKKDLSQTAAGVELNKELAEQIEKHKKELREMQEEMREAIRAKDEETRRELEAESKKLQAKMGRIQNDSKKLASDYEEERNRFETRLREMKQASEQETARMAAEYKQQMDNLQTRLNNVTAASEAERNAIMQEMNELRQRRHSSRRGGLFGMIGAVLDSVFGL